MFWINFILLSLYFFRFQCTFDCNHKMIYTAINAPKVDFYTHFVVFSFFTIKMNEIRKCVYCNELTAAHFMIVRVFVIHIRTLNGEKPHFLTFAVHETEIISRESI